MQPSMYRQTAAKSAPDWASVSSSTSIPAGIAKPLSLAIAWIAASSLSMSLAVDPRGYVPLAVGTENLSRKIFQKRTPFRLNSVGQ